MTTNLYNELHGQQAPLQNPHSILTIGAHPDDAEFGAGATIARWCAAGSDVSILVVTDGSKGSWDPDTKRDVIVATRIEEQQRALEVLGSGQTIHLGKVDGELEYTMDLRRALAIHIRRVRPDVVLTHDPWQRYQLHPDHRATGMAAVDAVVSAREPLAYVDADLPAHRPSAILLWSADQPDHAEPVQQEWFDRKIEALLCHSSQSETTMGRAADDAEARLAFIDKIALWHAESGEKLGIGPAEVFKILIP